MLTSTRAITFSTVLACACQIPVASPATPADDPSNAYEAWLGEVATGDGYVRWDAVHADTAPLDAYVGWIARPEAVPAERAAAHAFWLNSYNALVLHAVVALGVTGSVKEVPGWIPEPGSGFFLEHTHTIGGESLSLYVHEHRRVRAQFSDLRDHAALNCASASCPPLRDTLYTAADLDRELDDQMRRWVADPLRGVRIEGDELVLSPIFHWFVSDFGGDRRGLCEVLHPYAEEPLARRLQQASAAGCPHRVFDYDWSLNVPPR